jgi:hypothetical protein
MIWKGEEYATMESHSLEHTHLARYSQNKEGNCTIYHTPAIELLDCGERVGCVS